MVGGEAMPKNLAEEVQEKLTAQLHNMYGPTETTIWSATTTLRKGDKITIGKPIANTTIYILDEAKKLLPIGAKGEIYIGGHGVTRGYFNRNELTAERFITIPINNSEERIYKTGDLGKWLKDGQIEFLGRLDDQVKIRGYRIELGEIEYILLRHKAVKEAVVIAIAGENGQKELMACIVSDNALVTSTDLNAFLEKKLPPYMIPTRYVTLDKMPLNPNGKINKKVLANLKGTTLDTGVTFVAPKTPTEKQLAAIWSKVLDKKSIGIKDDFFSIGGHSLRATRVIADIQQKMGLEVPLREVFEFSTIEQLAPVIESLQWIKQPSGDKTSNTKKEKIII